MEYRIAKAYLDSILNARRQIIRLELSIERLEHEMTYPAVTVGGDRVQSSPAGDALERRVIKYVELLEKHRKAYIRRKTSYEEKLYDAESHIMLLPDGKPKTFLLEHYIDGVSELDYGITHGYETTVSVYNLKIRAVRLFANFFEKKWW